MPKKIIDSDNPSTWTERIKDRIEIDDVSGCWNWTKQKKRGYGRFYFCHQKSMSAHRASYLAHVGEIPDRMCVCHSCDNPACVNPDHLFLGTHLDNMRDRSEKCRCYSAPGAKNPNFGGKHYSKKTPEKIIRGEDCRHSILSATSVAEIRSLQKPYQEIARIYGVSISAIGRVKRRESWAHVS